MDKYECHELFNKNLSFWDKLSESDKEMICRHTVSSIFEKNANVHGLSGECTGTIFIKKGCLRAYILSENGKEITLYRLYPGDVCALSASCVITSITFDVYIDAEEESHVYIINGKVFADITQRNVYAENFALNLAVQRFSDVMWAMQQILFTSFDKRLAMFLQDEISKTGNTYIKLTHDQVAKYIGSAREVVSRMLKHFVSEGIVELSRGGIKIIDKKKLLSLTV